MAIRVRLRLLALVGDQGEDLIVGFYRDLTDEVVSEHWFRTLDRERHRPDRRRLGGGHAHLHQPSRPARCSATPRRRASAVR